MVDDIAARPQPNITQLEKCYGLVSKNSDEQGFFKCLFKYFQTLSDDQELAQASLMFWFSTILEKYRDNEKVLLEIFGPAFDIDPNLTHQEKLQKLAQKQLPSGSLGFLKLVMSIGLWLDWQRHIEVEPTYCFYHLYFGYYLSRKFDYDTFQKGLDLVASNPDVVKEALQQQLGDAEAEELSEMLRTADWDEIKKMSESLKNNTDYVPTDEWLKRFSKNDCAISLDFFHTDFIEWLSNNWSKLDNPKSYTTVRLSFDDVYPIVINEQTDEKYKFPRLVTTARPYNIIHWCIEHTNDRFATIKMLEKNHIEVSSKGIVDDLHKSIFNVKKGALRFFISKATPETITVHKAVSLPAKDIAELKANSQEVIPTSE